jgi:hypothetical protein
MDGMKIYHVVWRCYQSVCTYIYVDGNKEDEEELMAPMLPASSGYNSRGGALDFDSLLQQAQRSISKRGK